MNVLILGGQSPRHKQWVRDVAESLQPKFDRVAFLDYRHWGKPGTDVDLDYEIEQIVKLAEDLANYVIVAKSIGTVISTLAIDQGKLQPDHCVFMGFPLKVIKKDIQQIAAALSSLPTTIFVQNDQDPLGSAEQVREYLLVHTPGDYEVYNTPGDSHDYLDFDLITKLAASR